MKNKYTATLFAILFGWLGFHKFYLGKWFQGIIYIVFMLTGIPFIISLIEGIMYAFNSKEWFDMKYNIDFMQKQDYLNSRK